MIPGRRLRLSPWAGALESLRAAYYAQRPLPLKFRPSFRIVKGARP